MNDSVFRKESIERISAPEQLDDYLRVTSPAAWVILAAVALILISLFVWSAVTAMESYAAGTAEVRGGTMVLVFDDAEKAEHVAVGMLIRVGDKTAPILSVGVDEDGGCLAVAETDLPDGRYDARVGYKSIQIIDMLFN